MIDHEAAQDLVGTLDVVDIAGTVERVKAGNGKRGRIADVMKPGSA